MYIHTKSSHTHMHICVHDRHGAQENEQQMNTFTHTHTHLPAVVPTARTGVALDAAIDSLHTQIHTHTKRETEVYML